MNVFLEVLIGQNTVLDIIELMIIFGCGIITGIAVGIKIVELRIRKIK